MKTKKNSMFSFLRRSFDKLSFFNYQIFIGKNIKSVSEKSIIFFPVCNNIFYCGLAGIIAVKHQATKHDESIDINFLIQTARKLYEQSENLILDEFIKDNFNLSDHFLGDNSLLDTLFEFILSLKKEYSFIKIFPNKELSDEIINVSAMLFNAIQSCEAFLSINSGILNTVSVNKINQKIELLKDIQWALSKELYENIKRINDLYFDAKEFVSPLSLKILKRLNSVLNSIDRLEVRGRDSAGISIFFWIKEAEFEKFQNIITEKGLIDVFDKRMNYNILLNGSISLSNLIKETESLKCISFTYKVSAEVGKLGDNISFLRNQIKNDEIFNIIINCNNLHYNIAAHTRWASVGNISEENCHPMDNDFNKGASLHSNIIHVSLNGDIDNYQDLKASLEEEGIRIDSEITTDTKIIPLQIEKYLNQGNSIEESFRMAVNAFKGSHAIFMQTDIAPGKLFLAQRGSGQAIFVGVADDHYIPTSEVYGFVEETPYFFKLEGEKLFEGQNGSIQGQIVILDEKPFAQEGSVKSMWYDGTPFNMEIKDIKKSEITSRDIDRQTFSHYFFKEISESPSSVEKTLFNRWKTKLDTGKIEIKLNEKNFPKPLVAALTEKKIKNVYFIGQGTAGVAALVCSDILNYYMAGSGINISALKASELSGKISESKDSEIKSMQDNLVIAITQSGTTTDTNKTIDMANTNGAYTLAIVNRRESDITFKVHGVIYTSSGRDIEMSVASTKAFYSQIIAGTILGLYIAQITGTRNDDFITSEMAELIKIPCHMRKILNMSEEIEESAKKYALTRTYWAAAGSGPNKASSDEIRIKLSELCYKTISSDYIEDKKHIDLSAEPLIIICAAGAREGVTYDLIKDTAIFQAHKAVPIVITNEDEDRFDKYAAAVFKIPVVKEHLSSILNTLVGHLWGYYAALAINQNSELFYRFRNELKLTIDKFTKEGLDIFESILEKSFKETILRFYRVFRDKKTNNHFPAFWGKYDASDLTLLLKYLYGRLPVSDFELDFGVKGTPLNMLNKLFDCVGEAVTYMARPIDAIKHQAKTVTVGTSRIVEKMEGILFDVLTDYNFSTSQLINKNVIVLKNIQTIISEIKGSTLYKISGLNLLGEPTDDASIEVIDKRGSSKGLVSRVEKDKTLKGTKKIIVREGNVYIGKGRRDGRKMIVIPIISASPDTPNVIEYLLLVEIEFKINVSLSFKIKALGGKYERIKSLVQENIQWKDDLIEFIQMDELFGNSAEKIAEGIVKKA
ncbi:MAG: SIS domain-containing protein [Desulfobacterales bacterium]|nr:SIS domain-containing protein [Desulfobacterales bacterium]